MPFRFVECVLASQDAIDDFLIGLTVEWRVAAEQNVENDTDAPEVALMVVAAPQHFRCNVIGCPVFLC